MTGGLSALKTNTEKNIYIYIKKKKTKKTPVNYNILYTFGVTETGTPRKSRVSVGHYQTKHTARVPRTGQWCREHTRKIRNSPNNTYTYYIVVSWLLHTHSSKPFIISSPSTSCTVNNYPVCVCMSCLVWKKCILYVFYGYDSPHARSLL